MVHTLGQQRGTEKMKRLVLVNREMKEQACELGLLGAAGCGNGMHLIYTLLTKWDEQRPRNRKCGLWGNS